MADNEKPIVEGQETVETKPTPPVETPIDQTKAFSERLNKERAKIRQEALNEQAQALGYANHEDMLEKLTDEKLTKKGFEPSEIKPLLKELLEKDPVYQEALKYKQEKEALEKDIWSKDELKKVNEKYGTVYTSINELSPEVIKLWNTGISLDKAYAVENMDKISELIAKKAIATGKGHLTPPPAAGKTPPDNSVREPSSQEIYRFKRLNPGVTDEQIKAFINRKTK